MHYFAFLLRCGPARPSMGGRSVGLTRCYVSSERHPPNPLRGVYLSFARLPAAPLDAFDEHERSVRILERMSGEIFDASRTPHAR